MLDMTSAKVCIANNNWPSGELQLVPSATVELGSVYLFFLLFLPFFPLEYYFYYLPDYAVFWYLGARRVSVGDSRSTAIIKIFFSFRLLPLVLLWTVDRTEETIPSVLLIRANAIPWESLLLEVAELGEGNTQTKSHRSALLVFDINTVINFWSPSIFMCLIPWKC